MRLIATVSLALVSLGSLRADAPSLQGTLPEDFLPGLKTLLREAVEQSPSSITSSINLAQAEAARYSYSSQLWPQLGVNSSYQVNTQSTAGGASNTQKGLYYSASVNQPIFQWGAFKNYAEIGKLNERVAEKQFAEAYRLLAVSIRENYLGLIERKISLRNERFTLKIAEESLQAQQARFEAGSSSEAELQGYKIALEESKLRTDRAAEDFGFSKQVFLRLVGISELPDDTIPIELPHPEYSSSLADSVLAGFVGNGVESTFQSEVYQMTLKEQDLNYSIAKVRLLPKFSVQASISKEDSSYPTGNTVTQIGILSESYSIAANWSIFDGFATRGAKLSALVAKRLTEQQRQTYIDSSIDTISNMRHVLGFTQRAMVLAELHNALIEAEVKRLGEDKNLGYASQATIEAGISNLNATQYAMTYARTDYLSHWVEFISLAGIDPALSNLSSRYGR